MSNAFLVGVGDGFDDLGEEAESFVKGGVSGPFVEGAAFDKFHDVVRITRRGFARVIESGKVGVIEAREDVHFLKEASSLRAEVIGGEDFDGNPAKPGVGFLSFVDTSEGAFSKKRTEFDASDELIFMLLCAKKIESAERADRDKVPWGILSPPRGRTGGNEA